MEKAGKERSKGFYFLGLFIILGLLFNLASCGEKSQPPEKKKIETASKKIIREPVKPEIKDKKKDSEEVVAYHYDQMGKKDPFRPLIKEEKRTAEKMLVQGTLTPLQKYTLAELKLVAIVIGLEDSKAMVEDPKGDGYILSKGTLIGNKFGEVTEIKRNEVVVVEKEVDFGSGEIVQKKVSLILYKPEEEEL